MLTLRENNKTYKFDLYSENEESSQYALQVDIEEHHYCALQTPEHANHDSDEIETTTTIEWLHC